MTTSDLDPQFRPYVEWILAVARAYLGGATLTSTRRGFFHQARLYFTLPDQVCPPGTSTHELGLAVDLVVAAGSASSHQAWLGAVWNRYCFNTWSPADPVHFTSRRGCLR